MASSRAGGTKRGEVGPVHRGEVVGAPVYELPAKGMLWLSSTFRIANPNGDRSYHVREFVASTHADEEPLVGAAEIYQRPGETLWVALFRGTVGEFNERQEAEDAVVRHVERKYHREGT